MEPMSNSNGISLDELAGRGNFIPRPQADVKMRWYDLFSKKIRYKNVTLKTAIFKKYLDGYTLLLKIISGSLFFMHIVCNFMEHELCE